MLHATPFFDVPVFDITTLYPINCFISDADRIGALRLWIPFRVNPGELPEELSPDNQATHDPVSILPLSRFQILHFVKISVSFET
jgi:hypothetical protein